jgi:hypothetical protein
VNGRKMGTSPDMKAAKTKTKIQTSQTVSYNNKGSTIKVND